MYSGKIGKVNGPYDVINFIGINPTPFLTFQYSEVVGSQIFVSVNDSGIPIIQPLDFLSGLMLNVGAEIGIYGSCQGYESCVKEQFVRNITGPMAYKFEYDEPYDRVIFKARMRAGGVSNNDIVSNVQTSITQAGNLFIFPPVAINVNVFVQARQGR